MKNYTYGLLTSFLLIVVFAFNNKNDAHQNRDKQSTSTKQPKAEEVPLIVKDCRNHEFYVEQAKLWRAVLEKNKKNENAWFNLFKANRFSKLTYNDEHSPELSWTKNTEWIKDANHLLTGDDIVKQIEEHIPGTFMAYYIKYYHGKDVGDENFDLLEKAYKINPDFSELYDDFVIHYELRNNREKRKEFNLKWYQSNDFSENFLNFYYNLLSTLKQKSILFTYGDNPLFSSFMLQDALDYREDVTLMNIPLMVNKTEYRNAVFNKLNIPSFDKTYSDGMTDKNMKELMDYVIKHRPKDTPVYFGMAINKAIKKQYEDKLYLVGLALEYSETNIDNLAELINNYENKYLLDYLKVSFKYDVYKTTIDHSYIHSISALYDHYKASGDLNKTEEMRSLALQIASNMNEEYLEQDKAYINHYFTK